MMSYLDNLYIPPTREILNEEYLYNHNIEIDDELIIFINENYDILQVLIDEGYDITNILNERTLFTFSPSKNDGYDNLRRTLTDSEKKCFDSMYNHRIRRAEIDYGVTATERFNEKLRQRNLPPTQVNKIKQAKENIRSGIKRTYSDDNNGNIAAYNNAFTNKIGINKPLYKKFRQGKKVEIDPYLKIRKYQIKKRLLDSDKFKSLPKEKQIALFTKIDKKSYAPTFRAILNHEKEHVNQNETIRKELGKGSKFGEIKALMKASKLYDKYASKSDGSYASTPFEYGANLKALNQLTPQQSKELALHQVDPKKYPLKSIKIDPNKAKNMATHSLRRLKDNKGRFHDYFKTRDSLIKRIQIRNLMKPKLRL